MATETSMHNELQAQEGIFQWTKQWYAVAVVEFLDPSRPHAMQLLGKDIVLWRDGSNKYSTLLCLPKCPEKY